MLKWTTYLALPVSLWASWAAWRGPPPPSDHPTPPALTRSVTAEAKSKVSALGQNLTEDIQAASNQRGAPIATTQLEATDEEGVPYLTSPIPDNPLMPGIASVVEACPPDKVNTQADWVYCPDSGIIRPVLSGQSVSGKE